MHDTGQLPTLVLLLKAPQPGEVKTRLAAELGAEEAVQIYRRLVERQVSQIPPAWQAEIWFSPADQQEVMEGWLGSERFRYFAQPEGGLGERLRVAMEGAFRRGAGRLFLCGADCPDLIRPLLDSAAEALRETDVVLGPAEDGGYYLLGMNKPAPELFENIAWSTDAVLRQTLERAREAGLACRLLSVLADVDEAEVWRRVSGRLFAEE